MILLILFDLSIFYFLFLFLFFLEHLLPLFLLPIIVYQFLIYYLFETSFKLDNPHNLQRREFQEFLFTNLQIIRLPILVIDVPPIFLLQSIINQ